MSVFYFLSSESSIVCRAIGEVAIDKLLRFCMLEDIHIFFWGLAEGVLAQRLFQQMEANLKFPVLTNFTQFLFWPNLI